MEPTYLEGEAAITRARMGKGSWEVARELGAREFPEPAWCIEKWFLEEKLKGPPFPCPQFPCPTGQICDPRRVGSGPIAKPEVKRLRHTPEEGKSV